MSTSDSAQKLWDFALAYYAQPLVADACLQIQDQFQANVCLLIGLRWLDIHEQHLDDQQLTALNEHVKNWADDVVVPLRFLRRKLKLPHQSFAQDEVQEQLRAIIKQAELLAEKKLLIEIERWISAQTFSAQGGENLERYLFQRGVPDYLHESLCKKI